MCVGSQNKITVFGVYIGVPLFQETTVELGGIYISSTVRIYGYMRLRCKQPSGTLVKDQKAKHRSKRFCTIENCHEEINKVT